MNRLFSRLTALLLCITCLLSLVPLVSADETVAEDLSKSTTITGTGYGSFGFLFDKNDRSYSTSNGNATISLKNAAGMGSLYLMFNLEYGSYTITDDLNGKSITAGEYSFLHEYIDLTEAFGYTPTEITLQFSNGSVRLSEIYVFSPGTPPDFVQLWEPPLEGGADILLLATHGDDDQLYFAGLFPYYAGELNCRVQVAYMTDHRNNTYVRTHEMLNGLWATGVKAYPVFGRYADFRIDSLRDTYNEYARMGVTKDSMLQFVTEQLRRFRPLVAVGHDVNGEYGHGMHMVYSELLREAVEITNDPTVYPEQAKQYGTWDVPKTYLHLYKENPSVIDYDKPLETFDGLTAYQVTKKYGFPCHKSQQGTWFTQWLNGYSNEFTKATQITSYSPCNFGLFRSTVGEDVAKNDFLENVITYAEQERLEAERLEAERLEAERKEQERLEAERKEQERLEAERKEKERLEAERKEKERLEAERLEAERKEQERIRQEKEQQKKLIISVAALGVLVVLLIVILCIIVRNSKKKRSNKNTTKNNL